MITDHSGTIEWLEQVMKTYRRSDPGIVEKTIMALTLLEQLAMENIQFVFKGGTSLILLLQRFNRFSLDIDILLRQRPSDLEEAFDKICERGVFKTWFEDSRKVTNVPKAHFGLVRDSVIDQKDRAVFVDILFQEIEGISCIQRPVKHAVVQTASPDIFVTVPTVDWLLGDKLTAFAPNTTGIPYDVGKETEIIKQLFDIGVLFDNLTHIDTVYASFTENCACEMGYRGLSTANQVVLDDCLNTAMTITFRGTDHREHFEKLMRGIRGFRAFTFDNNYSLESAICSSAKVVYLTQLLKHRETTVKRYSDSKDVQKLMITDPALNKLNKIKKTDPEAFFYLFHAIELLR